MLCAPPQPGIRTSFRRKAGSESLTRQAFSFPIYLPGGSKPPPYGFVRTFCTLRAGRRGMFFGFALRNRRCSADEEKLLRNTSCSGGHDPYRFGADFTHGARGSPWSFSNIKQRVHIHAEHGGDGAQLIIGDLPPTANGNTPRTHSSRCTQRKKRAAALFF